MNEVKTPMRTLNGHTFVDQEARTAAAQNAAAVSELSKEMVNAQKTVWSGRTASFYGDSITEVNYHYTKGYHEWVKDCLELESYNNFGVSGYDIAAIYQKMRETNDEPDILFIMGGVNDQTHSNPLGNVDDMTTDTIYGSLNLLCSKAKEKYPTSVIVFITPAYQTKYPHSGGLTSYHVSKAIKDVCERFSIPVYDNHVISGICRANLAVYTTDNCHFNNKGHEMLGKNLAEYVAKTFGYVSEERVGPYSQWVGKTLTAHGMSDAPYVTALIAVESDMVEGDLVTVEFEGANGVNFVGYETKMAGTVFTDDTGALNNGKFAATLTNDARSSVELTSDGGILVTVTDRELLSTPTTSYLKIPFTLVSGGVVASCTISKIRICVGGIERKILDIGAFFAADRETVTVSD